MCLTKCMKRLRLILFLLPVLLLQTGCSSTPSSASNNPNNLDANGQPVSAVPWNTPESWETQGQLGALAH